MNMKQDINVYTMMLFAAFVALLIGCIAMAIEMGRYPFPTPWNSRSSRAAVTAQWTPVELPTAGSFSSFDAT
jgi:hypothetical protein